MLADWHRGSIVRAAITAAIAWSAVHAYTGAIFVVLGVFTAMLIDPFLRGDRTVALTQCGGYRGRGSAASTAPRRLSAHETRDAAMGAVTDSLSRAVLSGESPPESLKSLNGFVQAVQVIEFMPGSVPGLDGCC